MRRNRIAGLVLLLLPLFSGCSEGTFQVDEEAAKQELQETLEQYLPLLAEAYAGGDLEPLRPWAAEKEMARIYKRVEELAAQGRTLVPTFRQVTVEELNVWNYSNAYATTLEVWDLEVYASGTEEILSQEYEQSNRVKYQFKRDDDRWRVLFRTIQE